MVKTFLIKPSSGACNMHCTYCFYKDEIDNRSIKSYGFMSIETAKNLIDKALASSDNVCFSFQGGEPTLSGLEFFKEFTSYAREKGGERVSFALQTNGYIIDREWAAFFRENGYLIGLSMDGNKKIHDIYRLDNNKKGTFVKTFRAASFFKAENVEFNILTTVNREVAEHIKEVFDFFKRNGFKYLQFIPCLDEISGVKNDYSLSPELYSKALKELFDRYFDSWQRGEYISIRYFDNLVTMLLGYPPEACGMSGICGNYYVIEGDGSVFPCDFYVLDEYKMGNINTDDIPTLDEHRRAIGFIQKSTKIEEECRACKYFKLCRGGCRRDRENFKEGFLGLNYLCPAYKDFFDYAINRLLFMAESERRSARWKTNPILYIVILLFSYKTTKDITPTINIYGALYPFA